MLYKRTTPSNSMQPASLAHLLERVSRMLGSESGITGQSPSEEALHRLYQRGATVNQTACLNQYRNYLSPRGYQLPPETTGEALWVRYIVDMFSAGIPTVFGLRELDLCIADMPSFLNLILDANSPGGEDTIEEQNERSRDTPLDTYRRSFQLQRFRLFGSELLRAIYPEARLEVRGRPILPVVAPTPGMMIRTGVLKLTCHTASGPVMCTLRIEPPQGGHSWYTMLLVFSNIHLP